MRTHYRNGDEVGLQGTGCDGCSPSMVNGVICHEGGCMESWRDDPKQSVDGDHPYLDRPGLTPASDGEECDACGRPVAECNASPCPVAADTVEAERAKNMPRTFEVEIEMEGPGWAFAGDDGWRVSIARILRDVADSVEKGEHKTYSAICDANRNEIGSVRDDWDTKSKEEA